MGSEEAVPGPSVFPSGEPGVSGDFWGSQEGCTFKCPLKAYLLPSVMRTEDTSLKGHFTGGRFKRDQNTGVGSLSLLQGIFLTQGSNPDLPYCRRFFTSYLESPSSRRLEALVPSRDSRARTRSPCHKQEN